MASSSSCSSSFIAFFHHQRLLLLQVLLGIILLLLVVTTTTLPLFVVSSASFLPQTPRCVGRAHESIQPPLPFVTCSFSTRAFVRIKAPAATPLLSSSSSSLNAAGKGFQQQQQQPEKKEHLFLSNKEESFSSSSSNSNNNIYSKPALYDLAFGFRDYNAQVDFLLTQHVKYSTITTSSTTTSSTNDDDDKHDHDDKNNDHNAISVLFLGAGPARHALIALNHHHHDDHHHDGEDRYDNHHNHNLLPRVASVTCIDNCSDMVKYGKELAADELQDEQTSAAFCYLLADMRDFASLLRVEEEADKDEKNNQANDTDLSLFDTCWILMGSLQHLTSNTDVLQCFANVYASLHMGGTFILELPHPKEELLGGMVDCTRNSWHVPLEDEDNSNDNNNNNNNSNNDYAGQLDILWGDDNDEFDPISQIRKLTVSLELKETTTTTTTSIAPSTAKNQKKNGKRKRKPSTNTSTKIVQSVHQVIPIRLFTAQEIDALATCTGFQVVAMSGALEEDISVHDDAAYRLVCILRKL